jgi:hypothetical protein
MGTGSLSSGVKQLGREAEHSPPSSAKVNKIGAVPPLAHTSWLTRRDKFNCISFSELIFVSVKKLVRVVLLYIRLFGTGANNNQNSYKNLLGQSAVSI